ncbi:MAG: ABC transporter permease [Acidobacteriota bacterium]
MVRLLSARLAHAVLLLLAVSVATFLVVELAPGDFLAEMRLDPRISDETVERLRVRYGLDAPLPVRYGRWLASVGRGELGYSFAYGRPVGELIAPRLRNTLLLTGVTTTIAWCLALALGIASARRPGGLFDRSTAFLTSGLLALPELPLAIFALGLAVRVPWLPVGGMRSLDAAVGGSSLVDLGRHLLLPTAVLVLAGLPLLVRHVRTAVAEALSTPHVDAARGHGIGGWRLLVGHVLPTAANPLLSLFGLSVGALVSGSLAVEVVMGWPGLGPLVLAAVLARDLHVVVAGALVSCCFLIVGNLLADLALRWLDPRLREV